MSSSDNKQMQFCFFFCFGDYRVRYAGKDIGAFKDTSYLKYKEVNSLHLSTLLLKKALFMYLGHLFLFVSLAGTKSYVNYQQIYSTWIPEMYTVHALEFIILKASIEGDSYVKQWFGAPSQFCGAATDRRAR